MCVNYVVCVCRYDLIGEFPTPPNDVGNAYIYTTYNKRLYITTTFACNYMFNTYQV